MNTRSKHICLVNPVTKKKVWVPIIQVNKKSSKKNELNIDSFIQDCNSIRMTKKQLVDFAVESFGEKMVAHFSKTSKREVFFTIENMRIPREGVFIIKIL